MERQYCTSAYTIDFKNKTILLMYNKKLNKWLQPGGHIEKDEPPIETAIRETYEETGVIINIIGQSFDNINYQPIDVEQCKNNVGDMIDIQYLAIPLNKELYNKENDKTIWFPIDDIENSNDIEDDIKRKVLSLYKQYK